MSDLSRDIAAIEISGDGGTYYTNDFSSVIEAKQAIERGDAIKCWWNRADGVRFEEEFWFNPERVRLIMTNRS